MNQPHDPRKDRALQARRAAIRKKRLRRRRQMQLLTLAALGIFLLLLAILLADCGAQTPTPAETASSSTAATQASTEAVVEVSWITFPSDRVITAQQYFVYDCTSERFLTIAEDADTRIYPASITKLFTAYVAMQHLDPDQQITAAEALNLVAAGSSVAQLEKGDSLTARQLVGGMILPSGNDAAYVLAAEAGRVLLGKPSADATTAINAFVSHMNAQARSAGMTGTNFANPDGIHKDDHYTTYDDLIIMAKLALEDPAVLEYAGMNQTSVTVSPSRVVDWHNTNLLVDPSSKYYCPYAIGLKTGQTPYAGSCLLSAFALKDTTLIIGVFGCPDIESRFADTLQLFNDTLAAAK